MAKTKQVDLIAYCLAAAMALVLLAKCALAQDADHPAFARFQISTLVVESDTADIPKLEAKAVEILRRPGTVTGEQMTLTEARAQVRLDANGKPDPRGRTDVARCIEIVITDRLRGIVQARVSGVRVASEHPEVQP
jgi:hypothetical protein